MAAPPVYVEPPTPTDSRLNADYPVLINPNMTEYNNQQFGHQICPIVDYDASNPAAVLANRVEYGLVKRIVLCVQGLVIPATYRILYNFSIYYLYTPITIAMTLAVLFWGYLMVVGKNSAPVRDAFTVAIKIGSVSLFTCVLGQSSVWPDGLFPVLIRIIDEMAAIVTTYVGYSTSMACAVGMDPTDIWARVDCALNTLVGAIFNPSMLLAGLLGFFVCAFISGSFGLFIALVGFAIIFILVFALLRATYITITAYVALALMAIISPIFITLLLFSTTRAYFEKWLKLTISFMLQPIFLFAYLAMMLAAFDVVIYDGPYSVYRAVVSPMDIGTYPAPLNAFPATNPTTNPDGDFRIGNWLFARGLYEKSAGGPAVGIGTNPKRDSKLATRNVGIAGAVGAREMMDKEYQQKNPAGILLNVLDNFESVGNPEMYPRIRGTATGYHSLTNTVLDDGQAHLDITGTEDQTLVAGDVISIAGVYAVNPANGTTLSYLQQFVVMRDIASSPTTPSPRGLYDRVRISPAIYTSGPRHNVNNFPIAASQVYLVGFRYTSVDVYKVDLPIERVSWQNLALLRLCTTPSCTADKKKDEICRQHCYNLPTFPVGPLPAVCDATERSQCSFAHEQDYNDALYTIMINYLVQLLLSLLIAFLTMYLFYLMLDMLPFIGAGMGEGMPAFGKGGMAMPGNKLIDKMKAGMGKLAGGGK